MYEYILRSRSLLTRMCDFLCHAPIHAHTHTHTHRWVHFLPLFLPSDCDSPWFHPNNSAFQDGEAFPERPAGSSSWTKEGKGCLTEREGFFWGGRGGVLSPLSHIRPQGCQSAFFLIQSTGNGNYEKKCPKNLLMKNTIKKLKKRQKSGLLTYFTIK